MRSMETERDSLNLTVCYIYCFPDHLKYDSSPVSSATLAATFSAKPILVFNPVPTAVPPAAS